MFDPATLSPSLQPGFVDWVNKYNRKRSASKFYSEIAALPETGVEKWLLEYQCLLSAYHAEIWETEGKCLEIGGIRKKSQGDFRDSLPDQIRAINALCGALARKGPERHAAAMAIQSLSDEHWVFTNKSRQPVEYSVMLTTLLRHYQEALRAIPAGDAREFSYMCCMWPEAREIPDHPAKLQTALAFDVLCLLEKHSAGQGLFRNNPVSLEKAQYSRASRVTLLLENNLDPTESRSLAGRLRKFVSRNPDIRPCHWPTM